jgi:hypothetical protein
MVVTPVSQSTSVSSLAKPIEGRLPFAAHVAQFDTQKKSPTMQFSLTRLSNQAEIALGKTVKTLVKSRPQDRFLALLYPSSLRLAEKGTLSMSMSILLN